jgi:hypothetical protein
VGVAYPPATVCGATPLAGLDIGSVEFLVGKHLAYWMRELTVLTILSQPSELDALLRTALFLAGVPLDDPGVRENAKRLGPLVDRRRIAGLSRACASVAEQGDTALTTRRWMAAAELTATRMGLLVCNDLGAAASVLRNLPALPSGIGNDKAARHLLRFSVSDSYFGLIGALSRR